MSESGESGEGEMGQPDSAPQQSSSPGENKGARKPVQVGDTFEAKRLDAPLDKMTREKAGKRTYTVTERKRGRYIKARPIGDRAEALAVSRVFGDVPVSSFKGAVGHTIAAAGAVEAALCLACFSEGVLPETVGLVEPDPACPANVLMERVYRKPGALLSNSFGFGGQNCALIFGAA